MQPHRRNGLNILRWFQMPAEGQSGAFALPSRQVKINIFGVSRNIAQWLNNAPRKWITPPCTVCCPTAEWIKKRSDTQTYGRDIFLITDMLTPRTISHPRGFGVTFSDMPRR